MSQGTFYDKLVRLEVFKRIFVFRSNIDFFLRRKYMVFGQKWPNFEVDISHLFISLGISMCRQTFLGIIFKFK